MYDCLYYLRIVFVIGQLHRERGVLVECTKLWNEYPVVLLY